MEPQEPAKNDETSGFSKRRISSILKAPRKSARFPEPVQQENTVECAKPVEKRNSRRVSFAPANDVLLFSKDVKNAFPARSPLQELATATGATTQNRAQVEVTEDGSQQIMGMETLLNAPLHTSQQQDKVDFDTREDFGEKTVMFSNDHAFMDMTHSHTINIAKDADLLADISLQNHVLHTGGEKTVMFTADDPSMDMTLSHTVNMSIGSVSLPSGRNTDLSVERRNISSSVPTLDPGFENFLASLSKPSGTSSLATVEANSSLGHIKTPKADVDKENQVPPPLSAKMEKSLNTSRKTGESSYGSVLCPNIDVSMNMTEAVTGRILGLTDDDDPFQCLFPTPEMYAHSDKRAEMVKTTQQQSSKFLGYFDPKAVATTENRVQKVKSEDKNGQITDMISLKNPALNASHSRHKINFDARDECREKTIMFSADDEFMDMTQSHTDNIAHGPSAPQKMSRNGLDPGFKNFLASLSKPSGPSVNPGIERMVPTAAASSKETINTHSSVYQLKTQRADVGKDNGSVNTNWSSGKSSVGGTICPESDVSMDMTEPQTGRIIGITGTDDPFQCLFPTQNMYPHSESVGKAKMTSGHYKIEAVGSSNRTGIERSPKPSLKTKVQRHQFDTEDDFREKTVRFSADDACMDVTQSHTVNIATDFKLQPHQSSGFLPSHGEKTVAFSANDAAMDMTQCHTVNIASNLVSDSVPLVKTQGGEKCGPPRDRSSSTHGLDRGFNNFRTSLSKPSVPSVDPVIARMTPTAAPSSNITICPEDDVSMDMTEAQTGKILGIADTDHPLQCLFVPAKDMYPQGGNLKLTEIPSQVQISETPGSSNIKGAEKSLKTSLKTKTQRNQSDAEDDCREKTVRFSADDAAMDVTRSHTVNIASDIELLSHQHVDRLPSSGERTVRFSANDAAMDVTRSHTVNIATHFEPRSQTNLNVFPPSGEMTTRFSANDAAMDVTRSHTVNIATQFGPRSQTNLNLLPTSGEMTTRFSANDAAMDVTRSHTVNIASDIELLSHQHVDHLPSCGERTVKFSANDAAMDVTRSHTVNIASDIELLSHQHVDRLPSSGERTVKFSANDAAMDVTRSHTVNIATHFEPRSQTNLNVFPPSGEMTTRFSANDAAMDVTRSHTVNIATHFEPRSQTNLKLLPTSGEMTTKFSANDAAMDVTRSHTVNIATDLEQLSNQKTDVLPTCGEKTMRFSAKDAAMDVTQSHTVNIASHLGPQLHQNMDFLPTSGEKTVRFNTNDAAMDMTNCLTVNIASNSVSDPVLPDQESNILPTHRNMDLPFTVKKGGRKRSSSARGLDPGFKNSLSRMSGPWAKPVIAKAVTPAAPCPLEGVCTNICHDQLPTEKPDADTENLAPGFVSATIETPQDKTMTDCPENSVNMDITEAQMGRILGQTCTDELPQHLSSTQDSYPNSDHLKQTEVTTQQGDEARCLPNTNGVEITNRPNPFDSNEIRAGKDPEPRNETSSLSQKVESLPSDSDAFCSRKSRRKSLANLQSKVRRLSHLINTVPDTVTMESRTAPLPELDHDLDRNSKDKAVSPPVAEPEPEKVLVNTQDNTQAHHLTQKEEAPAAATTTTPFNLKTKQLMSRLSMGGFKPKLPGRSKPDDPKKTSSVGEHTRTMTVNVTGQLSNFDNDVSDIYDEELGSYEDMSETLDTRSPQEIHEKARRSQGSNINEPLEEGLVEEDLINAGHGKKRSLPKDENTMEDEKRMKASTETATDVNEMELQSHFVECDGNNTTAPNMTTHTTDYSSSSHTASIRCEATFESTFKHSLFESQLEDYASDVQKKLDDGTITVLEFFKLFNIDFVIHNPRQSVLPGRLSSDTDRTPMDLLKDRHILRPKQMVYETNVLDLTEKVEGLKVRMQDLDKPLKIVNGPLWEEMRTSSEKELKSFGAKLKERNNIFRKTSKHQSHEMKEVLYLNLVQANLEEQKKLRGTIEEADEMIKSLDDCICELETELLAVEEKGFEDKPSLKSCQEEVKKVTQTLADNEREMSELELQKKQNSSKVERLKAETRNLESHLTMLHMVNEWKFGEKSDNCTIYTFLHGTMHLQLVYEKSKGTVGDNQSERKISHINFKLQLDDERSQCHARLVHKLLSQYIKSEISWVEKYPTSRHVPKLLHDVGLVVSRCRLLGEELRLLKMWGGLKLDILEISCVDTQVCIVFSSLKKFSKFEVVFSVGLIGNLCVLRVESFKNMIGNTVIQQIEEIVASFSPVKNLFTKIVKKIHETLLC